MNLTVRMHLDKGRDRMTAQQAVRLTRLTETFSDGHVLMDDERKLDAVLDAIEQLLPPRPRRHR